MTAEVFYKLLNEIDTNCLDILGSRNSKYSSDDDRLHNFNAGAEILGGTPAQACWGYLVKHLTALRDMIQRDDFSDREDFLEKCTDCINYIRLLYCIGNSKPRSEVVECNKSSMYIGPNSLDTTAF